MKCELGSGRCWEQGIGAYQHDVLDLAQAHGWCGRREWRIEGLSRGVTSAVRESRSMIVEALYRSEPVLLRAKGE